MRARYHFLPFVAAFTVASIAACGGGSDQQPAAGDPAATTGQAAGGAVTPDPGGQVISIDMVTDELGNNIFIPADIEARKGDVLRFVLVQGVHNQHFLADSNPGAQGLPPAGPLLQMPGQTDDVKVTWGPGRYYFHCDPHALLGMIGHLTVK